jgi:glycosyltransferase involved in cell wall biosynthesis
MRAGLIVRWPIGGIRTYLRDLLADPAFADVSFDVVLPRHEESEALAQGSRNPNVTWRFAPHDYGQSLYKVALATINRSRFDVLHSHGVTAGVISAGAMLLRKHPHLLTPHETLNAADFAGRSGKVKHAVLSAALGRVSAIHCLTDQARENLFQYFPAQRRRAERVRVIRHGIDLSRFQSAHPRDMRTELGIPSDSVLLGFLGRFMEAKGFDVLIDAVALLAKRTPPVRPFIVLAVGYGGMVRENRARVAALGLADRFRFMDFVTDVAPILKGIDVMVMPSRWEASGLLAMEAMVCGTPTIGTRCIGLSETLADTPARMAEPGSPESLAAQIEAALEDTRAAEAQAFTATAARRFDSHNAFRQLRALYDELAARKST